MLDILAVLGDECRSKLDQCFSYLRDDFGADEVFHWLLRAAIGMDGDLKLKSQFWVSMLH